MKTGERTNNLIYDYCLLRYRQELDLKQFKLEGKYILEGITSQFQLSLYQNKI